MNGYFARRITAQTGPSLCEKARRIHRAPHRRPAREAYYPYLLQVASTHVAEQIDAAPSDVRRIHGRRLVAASRTQYLLSLGPQAGGRAFG